MPIQNAGITIVTMSTSAGELVENAILAQGGDDPQRQGHHNHEDRGINNQGEGNQQPIAQER